MPRPDKVQAVEEIRERFDSAQATFLAEYRGLTVTQQQKLRRELRAAGGEFKVVKMSLARRAADALGIDLGDELSGPTGLAFADSDAVTVAKVLRDFAKDNDALVVKSGVLGVNVLTPESVIKLAALESREILLAKIAGAAKAPLVNMAGMLQSFTRDAASMFSQLLEKKPAEDASEPVAVVADEEATASEPAAPAADEVATDTQAEAPVAAAAEEE